MPWKNNWHRSGIIMVNWWSELTFHVVLHRIFLVPLQSLFINMFSVRQHAFSTLAIADSPSEDEVEISHEQENLNTLYKKEAEAKEVMLKSEGRFFTLDENLLSNAAQTKWNKNCYQSSRSGTLDRSEWEQSYDSLR